MFVDRVTLYCQAGDGGNGCSSFRREKYVPRGGPDGGDGGNGGSVAIQADRNLGSLTNLTGHRHWNAERGEHGKGALRTGRRGKDTVILVPPGTLVMDAEYGHLLKDLQNHEDRVIIAKGGRGGRGNKRFATATNQAPRESETGEAGEYREITLELKLIADVGLIGKPNAGKSTLLSRVSHATPEIGEYPFTTTYPNLGVVRIGFDHEYVLADIPGLIEGAHEGAGLGHEFLKHVERTRVLVHLIEPAPMDQSDPLDNYDRIRQELERYNPRLAQRPEILCVTKAELPDAETCAELLRETSGREVHLISAATGQGLDELHWQVLERLSQLEDDYLPMTPVGGAGDPPATGTATEKDQKMKVLLANPRGFCAGVNMAIECLDEAIRRVGPNIFVYHEIVHNKYVVDRFTKQGVTFVDTLEEVPEGSILLFSAHGVSPEIRQLAKDRSLQTVDATCPLVTKVHLEAIRYARDGYNIILIGHHGHDEVIGTMGEAPESITLVETPEEVTSLPFSNDDRLAYLTQTTLSIAEAGAVIEALKDRYSGIESPKKEDICYATTNRQEAVKMLVGQADVLIVLGSQNSSNSKRLMEIGAQQGVASYLVDGASDMRADWFTNAKTVVVTAGASAPEVVVQECIAYLESNFDAEVTQETLREESVHFQLPRELQQLMPE